MTRGMMIGVVVMGECVRLRNKLYVVGIVITNLESFDAIVASLSKSETMIFPGMLSGGARAILKKHGFEATMEYLPYIKETVPVLRREKVWEMPTL